MAETKPVPMVLVRSNEDIALDLMRFIAEATGRKRFLLRYRVGSITC